MQWRKIGRKGGKEHGGWGRDEAAVLNMVVRTASLRTGHGAETQR